MRGRPCCTTVQKGHEQEAGESHVAHALPHRETSSASSASPSLAATPQVIVLTKGDLPEAASHVAAKIEALKAAAGHGRVIAISSVERKNLRALLKRTGALLDTLDRKEGSSGSSAPP